VSDTTSQPDEISVHFDRILFATDFSRASAAALPYVAAIARRFGSELCVAHVISAGAYQHIPAAERSAALERMRADAESQITAQLTAAHFSGIPHQVVLEHGEVWPVLSSLAESRKIDLIAAGTHGPHGFEKLVAGATAEEISRLAKRPVLLVGPEVTTAPEAEVHLERIMYVTDFSRESRRAMKFACALSRAYAAHLFILHVVDNPLDEPLATRMSADAFCRLRLLESRLPEGELGVEPEFVLEFGERQGRTLDVVEKKDIQLLVLRATKSSHAELSAHLPGQLEYNLVTHARCPVVTIHCEDA